MIYLEGLRRERESPASAFFQFRLNSGKSTKSVHAFVEGHDDPSFYTNFLRLWATDPEHIYTYICGNKRGVYELYRKIREEPYKGSPLFFVDKDLSDILADDLEEDLKRATNIYTTEYYSIENYLVSDSMLARVWRDLFHFKNVALDFNMDVHGGKFRSELERFYQFLLPITAWIIYLRRNGKKPNVNNLAFARFFDWEPDLTLIKSTEAQTSGDFQLLEKICGEIVPVECELDISAIMNELAPMMPKMYIRGKLELCFFVKFVDRLVKMLKEQLLVNGGDVAIKTQLNEENAIEILGPRLPIPPSLEKFLRENLADQSNYSTAIL